MAEYRLAPEAERDLLEIGRYTMQAWGADQAARYLSTLEERFEALARAEARDKTVFDHRTEYRVSRCRHHYIFFVRDDAGLLVLAVLHENMDLIARLRGRLGPNQQE